MERVKQLVEDLTRRGFITESDDETTGWIIRTNIEHAISEAIEEDRIRTAVMVASLGNGIPSYELNRKILSGLRE